ncbi:hypothetical protein HOG16_05070 [Candidatus Woesearchaeota archaeon]|jgi:hypothetical protein|nr:hypothetical protein [archaeon]MBT3691581.1 hypothetical protein [Candidatus Woesearchaeota archaeon]MBT4373529.1 hypothetical protein [archaeon]MBT4531977.1 hypothetical protein [archaeon]MBT7001644.1 hypothetical protein [archaeon]
MNRKDFIDGLTLIGFALIFTNLTKQIVDQKYLGFITPDVMWFGLVIAVIFTFFYGAKLLIQSIWVK